MTSEDLMIADLERSVAIAGIMGGATSEVSATTSDVLLESATFAPVGVLRTARRLELRTEASIRFERGADPEAVPVGAARAAELMRRWAGGTVLRGGVEAGAAPPRRHVTVRASRATALIGYPVSTEDAGEAFGRLGVSADRVEEDLVDVEVPGYRPDLQMEVDLIEEIVRVQGYDLVGTTVPGIRQAGGVPSSYDRRRQVRAALAAAGLRETWSASFASREDLDLTAAEGVRVANPLTADQTFLRASLVPALLAALRANLARQVAGACLFEVGTVFARSADGVEEGERAGFAMVGPASTYPGERRDVDVFDGRGVVEALLEAFGVEWGPGPLPAKLGSLLHPGRSAAVLAGDGEEIGWFGELHPGAAARLDLAGRVPLGELDVAALSRHQADRAAVVELPRFPPVRRDLAFVLDRQVPAGRVRAAIAEEELVESVTLFDVFEGPPLPEGRRNLAFNVEFRAADRTLTDADADRAVQAIAERLASTYGAVLRTA
jgi:phenylalanyl-tRNA synthetase beta chain